MTLGRDQIRQGDDDYHQCDDNQRGSRMLANGEAHPSVQSWLIVMLQEIMPQHSCLGMVNVEQLLEFNFLG
jgi:hypothetical protein